MEGNCFVLIRSGLYRAQTITVKHLPVGCQGVRLLEKVKDTITLLSDTEETTYAPGTMMIVEEAGKHDTTGEPMYRMLDLRHSRGITES